LVRGPGLSREEPIARTPYLETLPYVGFSPTIPHHDAGRRIEPAVSVPMDAVDRSAAKAAAEPPLEPPGSLFVSQGFLDGP
jgi:hypothetical protein